MKIIRILLVLVGLTTLAATQKISERLRVDASDAPRNILHSVVTIPVTKEDVTLVYPKWLPGNHRPTGPIQNLTGLHIKANGQELEWQRDLVDMWAFHVKVPAGTRELEASFDTITYSGHNSYASSKLIDLIWNQVVLYPKDTDSDAVEVTASLVLPEGWKFGTALTTASQSGKAAEFQPVSLTRLVDSPLIAGLYYRQIEISPSGEKLVHVIDLAGESEESLQMSDKDVASYKQLVAETGKLFGARHYEKYHFLWALSDQTHHGGLEHHESSDNGTMEDVFSNPNAHNLEADLLPHEFVHSWNGKYRRPYDLATPNYQEPMKGDLLWVYEGFTDYLGNILAARVGLRTPEQFRENLAYTAAMLDHRAGRNWRPLQDTATSVQILFAGAGQWLNWRRGADYYPEGYLIWLEVDAMIRRQTNGQKSLNDFCRSFYGPPSGPPKVVTYKFEDIAAALNQVVPYDWAKLLRERLDSKSPRAPLGGIEQGGWKLIYNDQKNSTMDASEKVNEGLDFSFSLGIMLGKDGTLVDVIPGLPAYSAGLGPGMKVIGVNGRKWSKDTMHAAVKASAHAREPIVILAENGDYLKTYQVDYHGGDQYPHLVRVEGQPDILSEIIKPQAQTSASTPAESGDELKAVLNQMDQASQSFKNAQADVELVQYTAVVDEKDKQTGQIFFRRKGHQTDIALWIQKPHPKQAVVQDDKLTFLDVRTRQVTQRNLGNNKADVEAVMNLGFGGRGKDLLSEYNATFAGWETVDGTRTARLELVAKSEKLRQLFTKVVVWIDPQRDVALQQQRFESSGDYQLTHYTNIKVNTNIPDEKFVI